MSSDNSHDSGSFLTGLGLGLLGGAMGYFLFATDKGEKVRKKLSLEWKTLEISGIDKTIEKSVPAGSLKQLLGTFFSEMIEQARQEQVAAMEEAKHKKKKPKKKLFRGA